MTEKAILLKYIMSNKRFIEALGMHWANKERELKGEAPAYSDTDFFNLLKTYR